MAHIVRKLDWGVIDLDTSKPFVFFQQRWFYNWIVSTGATAWTYAEKKHFHNTLDRQIWAAWSNRVKLKVSGTSKWVTEWKDGVPINFDVKWVLEDGHWTVNARKLPKGGKYRSNVVYSKLEINLDSEDLASRRACTDDGVCEDGFRTVPHEFGHALQYKQDEYKTGHKHLADTRSIMNIGDELRARHLTAVLAELNTMLPDTTFAYS
ncbi:MAG: hypothetical protein QNK37_09990 [Acidobacteriota bacterium]|nr:hypothetical protein [Acidobacteriota bacterium]